MGGCQQRNARGWCVSGGKVGFGVGSGRSAGRDGGGQSEERDQALRDLGWQNGYGIFSLGFSQIKDVRDYIAGQEEHLRKASFQDEFRALLQRYEIAFDERYVWD